MSDTVTRAVLHDRALISVSGPDWRSFLQGQLTQDVETLTSGDLRFGALLSPQGRLLFDLFILGREDGCWLDVPADRRDALIARLTMYRLRAKCEITAQTGAVIALWGAGGAPQGFVADPRLAALGFRGYGDLAPVGDSADYDRHRLALGIPDTADYGDDATYPIEANFDLLNGIDFKKGCFVGQETTSRMKRRGQIKSRMLPITFDGPPPAFGAEVLNGELRAGQVLSGVDGQAIALLRLDRIADGAVMVDGRPATVERPAWIQA